MKYDRDIRWMRIVVWVLIVSNLGLMGRSLYLHEWFIATAFAVWVLNLLVWLGTLNVQQKTRNQARIVDAAVQGVLDLNQHFGGPAS